MTTSTTLRWIRVGLLLGLVGLASVANAPAPYWACQGKAAGERCTAYGSSSGSGCSLTGGDDDSVCRLVSSCTDNPETDVNECLYCQ
jgi:hypothetical protein